MTDFSWWVLLFWMAATYFWATDPALVVYPLCGWIVSYMYLFCIKNINIGPVAKNTIFVGIIILFSIIMVQYFGFLIRGRNPSTSLLGIHRNIISISLISLFPFVLFFRKEHISVKLMKMVATFALLIFLIYANSRGSILAFFSIIVIYIYSLLSNISEKRGLVKFLPLILVIGTVASIFALEFFPRILKEFFESNELDRWYMIRNSFWLFESAPIQGVGLGNWHVLAYQFGFEDFSKSNSPLRFDPQPSHNLYFQLLAELGAVGFLAFMAAWFYPLIYSLRKFQNLDEIEKASSAVVTAFAICLIFFAAAPFGQLSFSPSYLIALFCLAILARRVHIDKGYQKFHPKFRIFKIILLLAVTMLLIYVNRTNASWHLIKKYGKDHEGKIAKLESIYNKRLKTTIRRRNIPYELAKISLKTKEYDRTIRYFEEAVSIRPYNVNLLLDYATFLLKQSIDLDRAKELSLRAHDVHEKLYKTNFILAKICFAQNDLLEAKNYLKFIPKIESQIAQGKKLRKKLGRSYSKNNKVTKMDKEIRNLLKESRQLRKSINRKIKAQKKQ